MRKWHFYDLQTGMFTGRILLSPAGLPQPERVAQLPGGGEITIPAQAGIEIPAGCGAVECSGSASLDIKAKCIDTATGQVIDYQPPPPADDQWQTWVWDATTKRWVSSPTLAAIKRAARQAMAGAWNTARAAGVMIGGKVAPTDADSWVRYLAIKAMTGDGGWIDMPIPLVDGTFEPLTQAKATAMWSALKDMERTLLARLRDRIDAINSASTAEQVSAIVW